MGISSRSMDKVLGMSVDGHEGRGEEGWERGEATSQEASRRALTGLGSSPSLRIRPVRPDIDVQIPSTAAGGSRNPQHSKKSPSWLHITLDYCPEYFKQYGTVLELLQASQYWKRGSRTQHLQSYGLAPTEMYN